MTTTVLDFCLTSLLSWKSLQGVHAWTFYRPDNLPVQPAAASKHFKAFYISNWLRKPPLYKTEDYTNSAHPGVRRKWSTIICLRARMPNIEISITRLILCTALKPRMFTTCMIWNKIQKQLHTYTSDEWQTSDATQLHHYHNNKFLNLQII